MAHPRHLVFFLLAVVLGAPGALFAQRGTIAGTIRAEGSREPVPFATVRIPQLGRGVVASDRGHFVLPDVPAGNWMIRASALGYRTVESTTSVSSGSTTQVEVLLPESALEISGIVVAAERQDGLTGGSAGPGAIRVDPAVIEAVPALAEADVLRTLQMLPSVQATSDFSGALYVRGGAPDQNLMLLDGAPLFNPYHLGGVFGSIDTRAVAAINVLPGAFPARLGDRVSSVTEIRTREGGRDQVRGSASVGLVSSSASLDGPLPGARGSYLVSARRTYLDLVSALPYSFDDADLKLTHDVGELGRLSLSLHYDGEHVDLTIQGLESTEGTEVAGSLAGDFGTRSVAVNYWQPLGAFTLEGRAALSSFDGDFLGLRSEGVSAREIERVPDPFLQASTTIRNGLVAVDATWYRGRHQLRGGAQLDQYWFDYDLAFEEATLISAIPTFTLEQRPFTLAAYVEDQWSPLQQLELRLGMRVLSAGKRGTAWMPRLGVQYALSPRVTLSAGAGRYAQVMHSLRDEESLAAAFVAYDLLSPVPEEIGLTRAEDIVLGAAWASPGTSLRVDAYMKRYNRLPINPASEDPLKAPVFVPYGYVKGEGLSRGVEVLGRHRQGPAELSLAYAWMMAQRRVGADLYSPRFERRHTVDALAALPWGRRGRASLRFIFGTGQPYTPAVGVASAYVFDPELKLFTPAETGRNPTIVFGERNSERLRHYIRLDVGARRDLERRWFGREVTITPSLQILNVLNTRNVLYAEQGLDASGQDLLEYTPQLPILPTFGVEVTF